MHFLTLAHSSKSSSLLPTLLPSSLSVSYTLPTSRKLTPSCLLFCWDEHPLFQATSQSSTEKKFLPPTFTFSLIPHYSSVITLIRCAQKDPRANNPHPLVYFVALYVQCDPSPASTFFRSLPQPRPRPLSLVYYPDVYTKRHFPLKLHGPPADLTRYIETSSWNLLTRRILTSREQNNI